MADTCVDRFFAEVVREKLYSNESRLRFYFRRIFNGVDFENKRVLDIGGGSGLCSFFSVSKGAAEAVCLEPEVDGSSSGMIVGFERLQTLGFGDRVRLEKCTFQRFASTKEKFDIILLHNSINHLDEAACSKLHKDAAAREVYLKLFSDLYRLSNPEGMLIICDCSRHNFFGHMKLRNPFCRSIDWSIHQSPEVWASLLTEAGFHKPKITWTSFNTLGNLGKWILGNKAAEYFLLSHFCLRMQRG